eukprot:scpid17315/ scgid34304/ Dolichyl-diphosphooligosaccharide--protein glycosyltransferase 48 kDa subunit
MASHMWQPIVLVVALCLCTELAEADRRTLVLVDDLNVTYTHSIFFNSLRDRGFELEFLPADSPGLSLARYGEFLYENLIIFSPAVTEFGGSVDISAITNFIDNGGNVLVAGSPSLDDPLRNLATECGLEFDEENTNVIDHVNFDSADTGRHTRVLVPSKNIVDSPLMAGKRSDEPLLYQGIGMVLDPDNSLITSIVTGSSTTYSHDASESITEYPHAVGKSTVLVAALQGFNNARVVFTGSLDMFSDEFLSSPVQQGIAGGRQFESAANAEFINSLSKWVFKENGVLRYSNVQHHHVGESSPATYYTVSDNVEYSIRIEELVNGQWQPFRASGVQLEFQCIDPFIRAPLKGNKDGVFSTKIQLPDQYGVFKFLVDFRSLGYTFLVSSTQITVRPLTHLMYERFIMCAYPYYASCFSMMVGLVIFSAVYLFHREPKSKAE